MGPPAATCAATRAVHRGRAARDHGEVATGHDGLFGALFDHGGAGPGDEAWLQAMLDAEAALARALERAGLQPAGSGAAVTAAARAGAFDIAELGRGAASAGNPVPALVQALTALVPPAAAGAVHLGATSQDIIDTAAMVLARDAIDAAVGSLNAAAGRGDEDRQRGRNAAGDGGVAALHQGTGNGSGDLGDKVTALRQLRAANGERGHDRTITSTDA